MNEREEESIEIDIRQIMYVLLDKIAIIIFVGIVCAMATYLYSRYVGVPVYSSTARVCIFPSKDEDGVITSSNMSVTNNLAKDFQDMITTRKILEEVIHDLELKYSANNLVSRVKVVQSESSVRIFDITVTDPDPNDAKRIVDDIVIVAQKRCNEMMGLERISLWDEGSFSTNPAASNTRNNVIIAFAVSIIATMAVIVALFFLDDSYKTAEDVEKSLEISVLGSIPYEEGNTKKEKSKVGYYE